MMNWLKPNRASLGPDNQHSHSPKSTNHTLSEPAMPLPFITRVVLHNYRNISHCDVSLGTLAFLVGPNGSGKSNFLDALNLVRDAVDQDLDYALTRRNGLSSVMAASEGLAGTLGIRLEFSLSGGKTGYYAFLLAASSGGGYSVAQEECFLYYPSHERLPDYFKIVGGDVDTNLTTEFHRIAPARHQLALSTPPGTMGEIATALLGMHFYSINPGTFRQPGSTLLIGKKLLDRDGSNLTTVLRRLATEAPDTIQRIEEYLKQIVPSIDNVTPRLMAGQQQILEFTGAQTSVRPFDASMMSDGTLRVLGILTGLFQTPEGSNRPLTLVGVEEPEATIHPAAAGVLLDCLKEASDTIQVVVTSHSPELLDDKNLDPSSIISFSIENGRAKVGPLTSDGASVVRDRLTTVGELLRTDQIRPDSAPMASAKESLFSE